MTRRRHRKDCKGLAGLAITGSASRSYGFENMLSLVRLKESQFYEDMNFDILSRMDNFSRCPEETCILF